jgi:arylformamidase
MIKGIKILSYFIDNKTPLYGGIERGFKQEELSRIDFNSSSNNSFFSFPNHIGTHIDFPNHFSNNGKTINDYSPNFWIFNKVGFIQCEVNDLPTKISTLNSEIEILILKTGFYIYRGTDYYWKEQPIIPSSYANLLRTNFPNLKIFGFDMISLTSKLNRIEGRKSHIEFLLNYDILIIEDMNLKELNKAPNKVIVAPLLINNCNGTPCTIFSF